MLKYAVGLDISSDSFNACIGVIDPSRKVTIKGSRKFDNNEKGFVHLKSWIDKHYKQPQLPLSVCMEATGVYYERCALWLFKAGFCVSVVLPNKVSHYFKAIGHKSKNDQMDARGLCRMAAEQRLEQWQPMDDYFYQLRALTRQLQALQESRTVTLNQLHAEERESAPIPLVINQLKAQLTFAAMQIDQMRMAIDDHLQQNGLIAEKLDKICRIKGVSTLTVAVVLAETNGFALFKNARQLVSFAGYDTIENQSGRHVGKTRISKKGNSRLRRAMHMPAFSVVKYEQAPFNQLYTRTLSQHQIKMKSYVAVQKKLLTTIYALWKKNTAYDPNYQPLTADKKIASTIS